MTSITATLTVSHTPAAEWGGQYGKKLTTSYMACVDQRKHRVYVTCYGNAGSAWFTHQGIKYYLPDTAEVGETVLCEAA